MSDLEPDWESPLTLSLTPTAIFTVLFASADEVHTAWQSCVDSALVVGENVARDEGSANYCRLVEQEYEEDGSVGPWHDWCVEVKGGVPTKLYEDIFEFAYNRIEQVEALLNEHGSEVAAVILTPIGHPLAHPVEYPKDHFLEKVRELCNQHKTLMIFDEVRTGFRLHIGGAQSLFGITPGLSVFGKALANGYPIGAVTGRKEIMEVLSGNTFLSSTFFPNSESQVAALKTIEILERENVLDDIARRGGRFCEKVKKIVSDSEIPCEFSGAPLMPYITFPKDSTGLYKKLRTNFYTELIRRKVFLQPYHHGYIAYRHSDDELDFAAEMIAESLDSLKEHLK